MTPGLCEMRLCGYFSKNTDSGVMRTKSQLEQDKERLRNKVLKSIAE